MWRTVALCLCVVALSAAKDKGKDWWEHSTIYQIYPRSFQDSNGDGIGDLNGITSRLEHIAKLGAQALWLSPIFASPQADFGYDISNFTDIDKQYGTLADFDALMAKAKLLGLKLLLDFVPNHSSPEHLWFKNSVKGIKPYDTYYVWKDARIVNGTQLPPNNWLSVFGGSAWEWSPVRKQYYLHQFAIGQPDLNYRDPGLMVEMQNAVAFWLKRGVDGVRIDALNFMYEDPRFLDEPRSMADVPKDDYNYLDHIYTKDLNETYDVVKSWKKIADEITKANKSDTKIFLVEAYTTLPLTVKFYKYGVNAPMNFRFITDMNNQSTALDLKKMIDSYVNAIPKGKENLPNWVVGNHDNHRAASRFGRNRVDQLNMMAAILPGITIIYNGDEIGMEDTWLSFNDTLDTAGCNAGKDRYELYSRDPERTPMQWDNTTNAGFSTGKKTWLPVNKNYKTLNVMEQELAAHSHLKIFRKLTSLKKLPVMIDGTLQTGLVTDKVLAIIRRIDSPKEGDEMVVLLINVSNAPQVVDASGWLNIPEQMSVYAASLEAKMLVGARLDMTKINLPPGVSMLLTDPPVIPTPPA